MTVELERNGERCTARIRGSASVYDAAEIRDGLREALESGMPVTVDLGDVSGCDVTLLQLIVAARRSASARGAELLCSAPPEAVAAVLAASGLGFEEVFGESWEDSK